MNQRTREQIQAELDDADGVCRVTALDNEDELGHSLNSERSALLCLTWATTVLWSKEVWLNIDHITLTMADSLCMDPLAFVALGL